MLSLSSLSLPRIGIKIIASEALIELHHKSGLKVWRGRVPSAIAIVCLALQTDASLGIDFLKDRQRLRISRHV